MSGPVEIRVQDESAGGWTGGQYSLFRAALGAYLFWHFAALVPWGGEVWSSAGVLPDASASPIAYLFPNVLTWYSPPWFVTALLVAACIGSLALAAGWRDRFVALALWYVWACLLGRNPLILNPSLPYIGWILVAHAFIPRAPYGSLDARGRLDPAGDWRMPRAVFVSAWVLMAIGYTYSGYTKLISPSWADGTAVARVVENPLARPTFLRDAMLTLPDAVLRLTTWGALTFELAFAPLALVPRLRPWIWLAAIAMHLTLMVLIDFADLSAGTIILHLFTFTPAWLMARDAAQPEHIFYDGHCGVCHGAVRFVLAEDEAGRFVASPLAGEAIQRELDPDQRRALPDSVAVKRTDGVVLTRSAAVAHVLHALGGAWRLMAWVLRLIPTPVRDSAYDRIAAVRTRLAGRATEACPIVPAHLRARLRP